MILNVLIFRQIRFSCYYLDMFRVNTITHPQKLSSDISAGVSISAVSSVGVSGIWDNTRIITSESNKHKRWIKEAIEITKRAQDTINRDEGAYMLSHTWDSILQRPSGGGRRV